MIYNINQTQRKTTTRGSVCRFICKQRHLTVLNIINEGFSTDKKIFS